MKSLNEITGTFGIESSETPQTSTFEGTDRTGN